MEKKSRKGLWYTLIFAVTCGGTLAAAIAYGRDLSEIIRAGVSAGIGVGAMLFLWEDHVLHNGLAHDNASHPGRFFLSYLAVFVLCMFLPLIVADAWPFAAFYVSLALLSCTFIGAYTGTMLLMLTILVQGGGTPEFFMYVFAGFIALGAFQYLDEQFMAGTPLFITLSMQTVLLVCYHIMFRNETFSAAVLIVPLINAFLNFAVLIVVLNAYSFYVVRTVGERYQEINDPAYALMLQMRRVSEGEYQRAIHTDYLTQRVAAALGLDQRRMRTCCYYHRAAVVLEDRSIENILALYRKHHFPEDSLPLLQEVITHKKGERFSAEATVIHLCETVIASLQFMFHKDPKMQIDYALLVDKIIRKKEEEGELANSELSVRGLRITAELLKKETMYYDFLR